MAVEGAGLARMCSGINGKKMDVLMYVFRG